MRGRVMFSVICVVLSASQLIFAQPPFLFHRRHGPSWGFPNEIHGNVGPMRPPPPGVLVAGHIPPGARPLGPGHPGGRLVFTSPPPPSAWPNHGPQIQRAKESSHFEYEVVPHPISMSRKPPTILRPGPPPSPPPPRSSDMTQEIMRLLAEQQATLRPSTVPPPRTLMSRTDRPPMHPPMIMVPRPTPPAPTDSDFQEGYRILNDLFMEDSNGDIRNNLVGGSEVSFNGGAYYPITNADAVIAHQNQNQPQLAPQLQPQPQKMNETTELASGSETDMQIVPAEEKPVPAEIAESEKPSEPTPQPTPQMEQSESSYGPPQFQNGPPSHSSFMFTDPNEGPAGYTIHDHGYRGPPPPFHPSGNSVIPGPAVPQRGQNTEVRNTIGQDQQQKQASQNNGYKNEGNSVQYGAPGQNGGLRMPIMMMPITANKANGNQPLPSSAEVQYALGILARYASKQAQQLNQKSQPQQQQSPSSPNPSYGAPQSNQASLDQSYGAPQENQPSPSAFNAPQQQNAPSDSYGAPQQQNSPSDSYGAPQQSSQNTGYGAPQQKQQSSTVSSYLPPSSLSNYGVPPQQLNQIQGPSGTYSTTEENAITISASNQLDESSPFPVYGPPSSSYGVGSGGGGGGASGIIGAKVEALKSIQNAVKGGFRSITGLKAGILNAGLNAIGNLGQAKGQIANSLKIPVLPQKESGGYIAYGAPSDPQPSYGPPEESTPSGGWGQPQTSTASILNGVKDLVGQVTGTITQTGKAAVGIGLSKNQFIKNNFAIKGQMFTDTVSKKIANKNQYFQNVLKHVQSIFDAATARPNTGGKNPW
ncbi:unnamed protein product [Orchesella dallaii]|uniref:Uncharacterized protein n=1 Tax=Orchesella dallaii TaxID=48710 RepID=A0ABP1QW92_9HEXA